MRILVAPSALNLAAAARPRSGSGSSLTTSQRYWLWDPQRWLRPIWLQPARRPLSGGRSTTDMDKTGASTSPTFLCIDRSSGVVRGLAIASVDRLHCDKSEVAADTRRAHAWDTR